MTEQIYQLLFNLTAFFLIVVLLAFDVLLVWRIWRERIRIKKTADPFREFVALRHSPEERVLGYGFDRLPDEPPNDPAIYTDPETIKSTDGESLRLLEPPSENPPSAWMSHWRLATAAEILALPHEIRLKRGVVLGGEYRLEELEGVVVIHKLIRRVPVTATGVKP